MKWITLVIISILNLSSEGQKITACEKSWALHRYIKDLRAHSKSEPPETSHLLNCYDFVIIGAGSAGCVVANRLTEIPEWKVLLLEAGKSESFLMDTPLLAQALQLTEINWKYYAEPQYTACLAMKNRRCPWPRGKVMGGSSVLHSMISTRGSKKDYDLWEKLGNSGWSYRQVLPYFLKSEDMKIPELAKNSKYHSTGGPLTITHTPFRTPLSTAFLQAGIETGQKIVDYNGKAQLGFSYIQYTIRNGTRLSSSKAFLHPIRNRTNFHVKKRSTVTKILIDDETKKAYGVEFIRKGIKYKVHFKKEVILSAGAINSPHLLMVSGVGPKNHLKSLGIEVIQDLCVGYNLQDHIGLGGLVFSVNESVSIRPSKIVSNSSNVCNFLAYRTGPIGLPSALEALAFFDTKNTKSRDSIPDLELLFCSGSFASSPLFKIITGIDSKTFRKVYSPLKNKDHWMVVPILMKPKSKGRIKLKSSNPLQKPAIYANYLVEEEDVKVILKGVKLAIELSKTKAFQRFGTKLHDIPLPQCEHLTFGTDEYWSCAIKHFTQTIYHCCGTCKMGPKNDTEAVVDPRLKVHGISRIRVADASIMPVIPSAHTNTPTIMIGEKAADLIKEDWNKLKKNTIVS